MSPFVPGGDYDRDIIRSTIGCDPGDSPILIGRSAIALLVRLGDGDDDPSFPGRAVLHWPGEVPKRAVDTKTSVLVFVDRGEKTVQFVANARVASYSAAGDVPRNVRFGLSPSLARLAWLTFLGGQLPSEPCPPPEAALTQLKADASIAARWAALGVFIERWYGKRVGVVQPTTGALGPPGLHRLLRASAAVPNIFKHNRLVEPDKLLVENDRIIFLLENQGVCLWATQPAGDDPRVYYRENEPGCSWIDEPEPLSVFMIQAVLFEAILAAQFGASCVSLDRKRFDAVLERVDQLGNGQWNWNGAQFHARDGALVMTMDHDNVWLAAQTPLALSRFEDLVTDDWDHVAM